ncbi:MAG: hypothetical protein ABIR11_08890 [Candidatus Limnocylindrales bacterium]
MTLWARLTWQAADPTGIAASLAARLGVVAREGGGAPGAISIDLVSAVLEIRPWVRESPADDPLAGGRLVLEPVPGGEEPPGAGAGLPSSTLTLAAVGWATVELDRAEMELAPWLGPCIRSRPGVGGSAADSVDAPLGARGRVFAGGGLPGESIVLLEPSTEGRLAASLVRDAEGPCALYLRPADGLEAWARRARERGVRLSARRIGPLGAARLVVGGPVAGPHILVVDISRSSNRAADGDTIAP